MKSLKSLYKIGRGPSSSHTMGPGYAAEIFVGHNPDAASFEVSLYGSLAATGKGHMTDTALLDVLEKTAPAQIFWHPETVLPFHTNGMRFVSRDAEGRQTDEWTVYSIGGGALSEGDSPKYLTGIDPDVYPAANLEEILTWCTANGKSYWEYADTYEDSGFWDFMNDIWKRMQKCVEDGLEHEGVLPGPLHLPRKATSYFVRANGFGQSLQTRGLVYAYALAASEENASGGMVVTAPTCGSCGVMPAVLYHLYKTRNFSDKRIMRALASGGLFGNVVKQNASISGAEVGCQGEVGVACAMAAAATCQLFGGTPTQIEYAAEMGLEHHLGMTCDPVCGLVQIPCIERNAFAAARALDANIYSTFSDGRHSVSFDSVVSVMNQTGHDIPSLYKETAEGGLAKYYSK